MSQHTIKTLIAAAIATGFKPGKNSTAYCLIEGFNVSIQAEEVDGGIDVRNVRIRADLEQSDEVQDACYGLLDSWFEAGDIGQTCYISDSLVDELDINQLAKAWHDARNSNRRLVRPTWLQSPGQPAAGVARSGGVQRAGVQRPNRSTL